MAIYRVTVRTTSSVQPGSGGTHWRSEVVYCGADLEAARVEFLREQAGDYWSGYGNRARETVIEEFESNPEEIDDTEAEDVEVE